MPTGYTEVIYRNEPITLPEFIMRCARAMGAYVLMRDEPLDAPDPGDWKPQTSWHVDALERASKSLYEAMHWSDEEAIAQANADYDSAYQAWTKSEKNSAELRARYLNMLGQVQAWTPPTPDHQGLKDFMIEQLRDSIKHDCFSWGEPVRKSGAAYKEEVIAKAERDIKYHTDEIERERERTESRNVWTRALKESVGKL